MSEFLNSKILEVVNSFPVNGTHTYHWIDGFDGVTKDIIYDGKIIAKSEPLQRTYCCGLTFEVYMSALAEVLGPNFKLGKLSANDIKKMKSDWFVATDGRSGSQKALVSRGLGIKVETKDAVAGDFLQLWRPNGSGHSVVFLGFENGRIKYWSTQPSTNGIGIRLEKQYDELYFSRAFIPEKV